MRKLCVTALLAFVFSTSASSAIQSNKPSTVIASYYQYGTKTASGERFNPDGLTAAHRSYPFGTLLKVTNMTNGLSVIVKVNDRGPFRKRIAIDLSRAAAQAIKITGLSRVTIEPLLR